MYKSRLMVDDVLQDADDAGFRVLRIWGPLDIGDPPSPRPRSAARPMASTSSTWDPAAQAPAYNDGPDGLRRLDYVTRRQASSG